MEIPEKLYMPLRSVHRSAIEDMQARVKEGDETFGLYMLFTKDVPIIIPAIYGNDAEKDSSVAFCKLIAVRYDVEFVIFVTETWMASQTEDEQVNKIEPRNRSDRTEGIICTLCLKGVGQRSLFCKTLREPEGITFSEIREMEGVNSRFSNLCGEDMHEFFKVMIQGLNQSEFESFIKAAGFHYDMEKIVREQ